jgi:hypothetical protein
MRRLAALPLVAASCFSPQARDGLPCSEAGDCPPGQSCQVGTCSSETLPDARALDAAPGDAGPPPPPGDFGSPTLILLTCPGPVSCADVRDPFVSADGGGLVFTYGVAPVAGNYDIYYAVGTADSGFAVAASMGAINTTLSEHSAFLSDDGTQIWFSRQDISSGVGVRPYDQILYGKREAGPFDSAAGVDGGVNTLLGDERSPSVSGDGTALLFTRSQESSLTDHDVYLARLEGGQWNTIERVEALSLKPANERSIELVEERHALFYIRDEQIHEALWTGDDPTRIAIDVVHEELDAAPLDLKVGLWSSPDGSEIWFDSNRSGSQQIYRAVRPAPTPSGGRIRRRPIP